MIYYFAIYILLLYRQTEIDLKKQPVRTTRIEQKKNKMHTASEKTSSGKHEFRKKTLPLHPQNKNQ